MQNTQCLSCHGGNVSLNTELTGFEKNIKPESFLYTSHVFRDYLKYELLEDRIKKNPTTIKGLDNNQYKYQLLQYMKNLDDRGIETGK